MGRSLTLVVPMPPNIGNGSHGHWSSRYREKNAYWRVLDLLTGKRGLIGRERFFSIPRPPQQPFAKASIRSTMYLGGAMDDSNAMRRHKWVEDWLVTRGYLVDDRKKCLTWEGFPEQVIKRDGNYRIVLVLTPTEAAA
jgi:hypothetical protein